MVTMILSCVTSRKKGWSGGALGIWVISDITCRLLNYYPHYRLSDRRTSHNTPPKHLLRSIIRSPNHTMTTPSIPPPTHNHNMSQREAELGYPSGANHGNRQLSFSLPSLPEMNLPRPTQSHGLPSKLDQLRVSNSKSSISCSPSPSLSITETEVDDDR